MRKKLGGSQRGKLYGQRAQVETVNSMMKRNLGDALRARTPEGRRKEQMLRAITHNLMIVLSREDKD
jgi:Transposase DDE domain